MTAFSASLNVHARLKNRGQIQYLFSESNEKVGKYPLLLLYTFAPKIDKSPVRVLFSVSKKKFSRAVDRNRLKRLMRESYRRLDFSLLLKSESNKQLLLALVYTGKQEETQESISNSLSQIYDVLTQRISESH